MFLGLATGSFSAFNLARCIRCQIIKNAKPGYECSEIKKKKSVENLNKYANTVTVINSWQALFNE